MITSLIILSLVGLVLSWYTWYVGQFAGKKKNFKPVCDINMQISCTKAFSSEYGKHFGVSNGIWGLLFYGLIFILAFVNEATYVFLLSVVAVVGSFYLAYALFFKIRTFCFVCLSTYILNLLLFIVSYIIAF